MCPAGERTGRGPRSLLSARWGGAGVALRRAPAPGGSALAEAVGAGGGGRAGPGREGKGRERGEACWEGLRARGDGEGAAARPERQELGQRPGAALGHFAGQGNSGWLRKEEGQGEVNPARPHPGFPSWSGFVPSVPTFTAPSHSYSPDRFNEK